MLGKFHWVPRKVNTIVYLSLLLLATAFKIAAAAAASSLDQFLSHYEITEQEVIAAGVELHGFDLDETNATTYPGDSIEVKFRYSGRLIDVTLARSPQGGMHGPKLTVRGGRNLGSSEEQGVWNSMYETENEDTYAFGYLASNGQFVGFFELGNNTYYTEPASTYFDEFMPQSKMLVYRETDVKIPARPRCADIPAADESTFEEPVRQTLHVRGSSGESAGSVDAVLASNAIRKTREYVACHIQVMADPTIFKKMGYHVANTVGYMNLHVRMADRVFRKTSLGPKEIRIIADHMTVFERTDDPAYPIPNVNGSVMDKFFIAYTAYVVDVCFSSIIFAKNFGDTIGMAGKGYVCDTHVYDGDWKQRNKLIWTTVGSDGRDMPLAVNLQTFTHEVGHLFGSSHDPDQNKTCSPGGKLGFYLMYPYNVESGPLSYLFSPCSIEQITPKAVQNYDTCLKPTRAVCGNGMVEVGEDCDCGHVAATCDIIDKCCTPPGGLNNVSGCQYRSDLGYHCSDKVDSCCVNCTADRVLKTCLVKANGCVVSICDGLSRDCPEPSAVPDGVPCSWFSRTCRGGVCNSTVCLDNGLGDCTCLGNDTCKVCCKNESGCYPSSSFGFGPRDDIYRLPGSSCGVSGQCDGDGKCFVFADSTDHSHAAIVVTAVVVAIVLAIASGGLVYWFLTSPYGLRANLSEQQDWLATHDSEGFLMVG